jgi:hypothetical protein
VAPEVAGGVLNALGESIRAGDQLLPSQMITFEEWPHRIIPEQVPNPGEIVFAANRFYQRPDEASVPVLPSARIHPSFRRVNPRGRVPLGVGTRAGLDQLARRG